MFYEVERVKGIEPSAVTPQPIEPQSASPSSAPPYTQIRAQISGASLRELAHVVAHWDELSAPIRAAILALVDTTLAQRGGAA